MPVVALPSMYFHSENCYFIPFTLSSFFLFSGIYTRDKEKNVIYYLRGAIYCSYSAAW